MAFIPFRRRRNSTRRLLTILPALLMALVLAVPVFAGSETVTINVDDSPSGVEANAAAVTVTNDTGSPIVFIGASPVKDGQELERVQSGETVALGDTSGRVNVGFSDRAGREEIKVYTSAGTFQIARKDGSYTFDARNNQQTGPTPTPGTGGDTATLTFLLQLRGEVPAGEAFTFSLQSKLK